MTGPNSSNQRDDLVVSGLAKIADALLPGTDLLPAGTAVGAHTELLERALSADPSLTAPVVEFARRAAAADEVTIEAMQAWSEPNTERVVFALTASYYMSAEVRRALDYPGQTRRPVAEATSAEKQSDDLLAPVIERGQTQPRR